MPIVVNDEGVVHFLGSNDESGRAVWAQAHRGANNVLSIDVNREEFTRGAGKCCFCWKDRELLQEGRPEDGRLRRETGGEANQRRHTSESQACFAKKSASVEGLQATQAPGLHRGKRDAWKGSVVNSLIVMERGIYSSSHLLRLKP
jgi:hypothetical protein